MNIYYYLINIKYLYFFHKLLFDIGIYILYKKITKSTSTYLINTINSDIKNNGFVIIKLTQWLLCRYSNLMKSTKKNSNIYNFLNNFRDVYENCNLHSFKYTEKIFLKDFSKKITDIIEIDTNYVIPSASIAQVYKGTLKSSGEEVAMKIAHPELENQIIYPFLYYYLYSYITKNFKFFDKYKIPFDLFTFFNNITKQIDMNYEAGNLDYFYKHYMDNPLVCIPKPLFWSKNILIMEYIKGEDFEKIDLSNYQKHKYILLLNLFVRNNLINLDKVHGDLHSGNWKIIKNKNLEKQKIVIYDFGFCIDIPEKSRSNIHNLNKSIETNNQTLFINSVYNYLQTSYSKDLFIEDFRLFIEFNKKNINIPNYIEFCINKNYIFKSILLDLFLSTFLVNNYFQSYTSNENIENNIIFEEFEIIRKLEITSNNLMTLSTICDVNNCYNDLNIFFKDFIDENRKNIIKIKQKQKTITNKLDKTNLLNTTKINKFHNHGEYIDI